jgi:hypothetical protein
MAGITAFREAFFASGLEKYEGFSEFDARKMRYALYWAFYENTAYRNIHSWSIGYRQQQALYRYIRGIYNPSYRLSEFWRSHIWGGMLDMEAGDSVKKPSSIPIITENDKLRPAIAQLWQWSNMQIQKQIISLYGSVLGDLGLMVVDDPKREQVYIDIVHPGTIKDITLDRRGNVKGYVIEEERRHPYNKDQKVTYSEIATRDGDNVVYQTLLNGVPFAWDGEDAEWTMPYGFVPLVMLQHNNVGLDWGWSEIHSGRAKYQEVDDLASKLSDHVRKTVDAPWLFSGIDKPRNAPRVSGEAPSFDNPNPGREETPVLYGPSGADAKALVSNLDISATANYIQMLLSELERDYPELQMDIWSTGKDTSGRALRIARQRVETKVAERRPNYDDALVRAQQMALAIGGFRKYEGFSGFGLESYAKGDLDHNIGERDFFARDELDDIETETAFWTAAEKASKSGVPLVVFLRRNGWDEEAIKELESTEEYKAKIANLKMSQMMAQQLDENQQEGGSPQTNDNQSA